MFHGYLSFCFRLFICFFVVVPSTSAHNPDTSYTKIKVAEGSLEFTFIFDINTLRKLVVLDENQDQQVSKEELLRKAPVIYNFLRDTVKLWLVDTSSDLGEPGQIVWPDNVEAVGVKDYEATLLHFVFRKEFKGLPSEFTVLYEFFGELGGQHINFTEITQGSHREEEISFTRFEPDYTYDTSVNDPAAKQMLRFVRLGMEHIWVGYDHILFLLVLVVMSRFMELIKVITAFTVAHSITLILAALEFVTLPSRLVETVIALTIMYVALENLLIKKRGHRWILTFFFGLVHGIGFANVLISLGLPTAGLVRSLVSFNVGVELGQLVIVLVLAPIFLWLSHRRFGKGFQAGISLLVFLLGAAWFIERAFGLEYMPI